MSGGYHSVLDLAKYIVNKCIDENMPISNFKLQKILYLTQLAMLKQGRWVAFYEDIEAWKWGPVGPCAYYAMCSNGALPIIIPYKLEEKPSGFVKRVIDNVIAEKIALDPFQLQEEIEVEGSPWVKVYNNGKGINKVISLSMMKDFVKLQKDG